MKKSIIAITAIILIILFALPIKAEVTINTDVYLSNNSYRISFPKTYNFSNVKVSDLITLNVTDYYSSYLNRQLIFTLNASSTPTISIITPEAPDYVDGVSSWTYDSTNKNLTLNGYTGVKDVVVSWDKLMLYNLTINAIEGTHQPKFNLTTRYRYNQSLVPYAHFYVWDGDKCVGEASSDSNGLIQFTLNSTLHGSGSLKINGTKAGIRTNQTTCLIYNITISGLTMQAPYDWISGEAQSVSVSFNNEARINQTLIKLENLKVRISVFDGNSLISQTTYGLFDVLGSYSNSFLFTPTNITLTKPYTLKVSIIQIGSEYELGSSSQTVYISVGEAPPGGGGGSPPSQFQLSLLPINPLAIMPGDVKRIEVPFKVEGVASYQIVSVEFFGSGASWCKWIKEGGGFYLWSDSPNKIIVEVSPPQDAQLGNYEVTLKVKAVSGDSSITSYGKIVLNIGSEAPSSKFSPWILYVLIGSFFLVIFILALRKK